MLVGWCDAIARETMLFAAVWFVVGGVDDVLVDLLYLARRGWDRLRGRAARDGGADTLPLPEAPARIAVFVPAWDESTVIGAMLTTALARFDYPDYRLYVGCYPNDPATIDAVARVAEQDARVRIVVGTHPGPTTKADCLNQLWQALCADEARDGPVVGVLMHDAEDVVHPAELRIVAHFLMEYDAIQLPVLPLPHPRSRLVSGHYCDEFAEAHAKQLLVRQALGAGMPLAGVGCAIRRAMLGRIAAARGGAPFDASSLTEDYELGLTVATMGGRARLVRIAERRGGRPVAVRAFFPASLAAAVRQKARWMTGIALAGWDRVGWGAPGNLGDHWMRMRDRRTTLAMPVLAIAYLSLVAWGVSSLAHVATRTQGLGPAARLEPLLAASAALFCWRLAVRAAFVGRAYGMVEALWSVPRVFVSNLVSLLAARRAVFLYLGMLAGMPPRWDKTMHQFPDHPDEVTA